MISSLIVVAINAVMGTMIAWVLVRDHFRGKGVVNSVIDLPFALPTIVAGLTLLALYGSDSPVGIEAPYTKVGGGDGAAVRDPALRRPRGAAGSDRSSTRRWRRRPPRSVAEQLTIFRSIILPNLTPAIIAGCALAFARAIGEFGSLVLITGNIPFDTQVASVYIFGQIECDNATAAAAVSVLLLVISVGVLFALNLFGRWRSRHERALARFRCGCAGLALFYLLLLIAPLVMIFFKTFENGIGPPIDAITSPDGLHAFWLTIVCVGIAVPLNTLFGVITARDVVRHKFRGRR